MKVNFSDEKVILTTNSIFLAGPTLRNSTFDKSWRKEAVEILERLGFDGVVYIPEYGKGVFDEAKREEQALWERKALACAGAIVFWVPRELKTKPAFTTNVEFGTYMQMKPLNVSLGYPEDACKMWYLKWLYNYELPEAQVFHTLEETLAHGMALAKDPSPIGQYYFAGVGRYGDNSIYYIAAYDKIRKKYIVSGLDYSYFEYTPNEKRKLFFYEEIVEDYTRQIKEINEDFEYFDSVTNRLGDNMKELLRTVNKLKELAINIRSVERWGDPTELAKTKKGYRRRLKRIYRYIGKDEYDKFMAMLEKYNFDIGAAKYRCKTMERQLKSLENHRKFRR